MMQTVAKVIALYNVPEHDQALFEKQYFESHVPLIRKVPGLRGMEICRKPRNLMGGASPYLIATLLFDDMASLKAGMGSPEGQEAGNNIMSFASNYITLLSTEVEMESLGTGTETGSLQYNRVGS